MNDSTENTDNEYVLRTTIGIRENNKRPDIEAIKDYINKNFATDVRVIKGIAIELLDHNIIENRPAPKRNSYFNKRNNNIPIDVISVNRTPQPIKLDYFSHITLFVVSHMLS